MCVSQQSKAEILIAVCIFGTHDSFVTCDLFLVCFRSQKYAEDSGDIAPEVDSLEVAVEEHATIHDVGGAFC